MGIIKTSKLVHEFIRRDEEGNVDSITTALDNVDLDALKENEKGVVYEIKIKTNSKEKADKIMADWETIDL